MAMAHDDDNVASIGLRRGLKALPPIQTSIDNTALQASRWKRVRPVVPIVEQPQSQSFEPAPTLRAKPESRRLDHRKSSISLFNLFSRPKVERARGHHETGLTRARDETPRSPAKLPPVSRPTTRPDPVTVAPQPKPQSAPQPEPKSSGSRPSTAKSCRGSLSRRARSTSSWEPPPLFHAYPQALKHAKLQAPHASTETIMKTQAHKRQYSVLQDKLDSKLDLLKDAESDTDGSVKPSEKSQRRPTLDSAPTPPELLPQKVYILTRSGYMLQYAGAGESNRLPERVLQLGKDSAAFACDLIPGKHWVLQISQATNDDGTMTAQQPRSILSKLRIQGSTAKKAATNLLMVFENPEEMGKWLAALRQEIDILAGRKSRSDADYEVANESNEIPELEKKPSLRYLARRQSSQYGNDRSPAGSPPGSPGSVGPDWAGMMGGPDTVSRPSSRMTSKRQSYDTVATTIASQDLVTLNHLRGGSGTSMMSGGTSGTGMTMANSRPSSAGPPSPLNGLAPNWTGDGDGQRSPTTLKSFHMNPSAASSARRRSMPLQPLAATAEPAGTDSHSTQNKRHSTLSNGYKAVREQVPRQRSNPSSISSLRSTSAGAVRRTSFSRPFNAHGDHLPPTQQNVSDSSANDDSDSLDARRGSTLGNLPTPTTLSFHSVNRQTSSPKLGYRSTQNRPTNGAPAMSRRGSSLGSALPVKPTASQQSTNQRSAFTTPQFTSGATQLPRTLRRPASMQIRTDPSFLSNRRPMGVPARPASSKSDRYSTLAPQGTCISNRGFAQQAAVAAVSGKKPVLSLRRSMPIMSFPPPAPPPNMPLPAVPVMSGRRALMA